MLEDDENYWMVQLMVIILLVLVNFELMMGMGFDRDNSDS
jgi:hypothetical protein